MLTAGEAAGVSTSFFAQFLFHSIPSDHLIFSSPEPETWTMLQTATGLGLLFASIATMSSEPRFVRPLAWIVVVSAAMLAVATLVDVLAQWSRVGYEGWYLLRYVRGERFSLHMADLNAAGSVYVLAIGIAGGLAAMSPAQRYPAFAALLVIAPALWLTGSRSAFVGALASLFILRAAGQRWRLTRTQAVSAAVVVAALVVAGASAVDWRPDAEGSAVRAAGFRSQFLQTSARMFASAPVFGVGVGRYFDRSAEFMPSDLRTLYGNENAHNYFVQQFAELGIVGGVMFVWLAIALIRAGRAAVRSAGDPVMAGVFAGVAAYLLTCVTGHPLLVPEAAFPFWAVAGALAAGANTGSERAGASRRTTAFITGLVLAAGVSAALVRYAGATAMPPEHGFHAQETAADGTAFRWMARHGVTYIPDGNGFLRLRVQAPALPARKPLVVETSVAGDVVDRREIAPGRWVVYDVPARRPAAAPFRRVDLRANQSWMQAVPLGQRQARRPIAMMVGNITWMPLHPAD
jgi:O-antigen ligase